MKILLLILAFSLTFASCSMAPSSSSRNVASNNDCSHLKKVEYHSYFKQYEECMDAKE